MSVSVSFERSIRPDRVVISKTFRTSANGICQMPASNVPIYAMEEVAEAVRGARSNVTPTMKQQFRNQ